MFTLLPDLNVAPLKYAHVLAEYGGPVAKVDAVEHRLPEGSFFEASALLAPAKTGGIEGSGRGFAASKPDAIHSAISETIEAWAWAQSKSNKEASAELRFDLDSTQHGFSAFPGLGPQGAKKRAYFEAATRWALSAWWEGKIPHAPLAQGNGIQLMASIPGASTSVIWEAQNQETHFGVGTSFSATQAATQAKLSLLRNRLRLKQGGSSLHQQRLHYFASCEGSEAFHQRVKRTASRAASAALVADSGIAGPWHPYAHVWRCLFDCSAFHEKGKEYFLI